MMPRTLQARIARHFVLFATVLAAVLTFGAFQLLMETEDAVLDRYLSQTLPALPAGSPAVPWLTDFSSPEDLKDRIALAEVPTSGWHEIFASADGRRARLIRSWRDRLAVWADHGMESEYRLLASSNAATGAALWRLVDLQSLEYTESETPRLTQRLLIISAVALLLVWLLSRRLARSAMAPVVDLTARVRQHSPDDAPLAATDATDEVAQLARALDDAWQRERDALERERQFIADCSHELRTPLTVLSGALSLMQEETPARPELLARLQRAGQRLEGVARTFLVMAREERRRTERTPQRLSELICESIAEQQILFPHRRLETVLSIPPESTIDAHREVLLVLFGNLLSNTFQHSTAARLTIVFSQKPIPHLHFAESPQASHAPPQASTSGYGIGLPLVRRLAHQQGWHMDESPHLPQSIILWFSEKTDAPPPPQSSRKIFAYRSAK
jgi:signal transduction histidine kinase